MERAITGFRRDEDGDWIAELACGHCRHVRHRPPWFDRPWTRTGTGRQAMLGRLLTYGLCAQAADASEDTSTARD
ncbi:GNAT family acetyltransferase [Lysobacteraceae bacterium NML93-0399]|nr:GNAT family acetyltransferase [Xanthomonadaceae bacterium NML93-0399]